MSEKTPVVSIITPTTGRNSLFNLIESISRQEIPVNHIILWDEKREGEFSNDSQSKMTPESLEKPEHWEKYGYQVNNIVIKGKMIQGNAFGSALRSIGLMAANTEFVTFADDDIMWEENHLAHMLAFIQEKQWVFCKRKIWTMLPDGKYECLGVDDFESVGEEAKTPYKMVDNNCMLFKRRFGSSAAVIYREAIEYNDDRLMYDFLKKYAGEPGQTNMATVNQICPDRLIEFFRHNCTK